MLKGIFTLYEFIPHKCHDQIVGRSTTNACGISGEFVHEFAHSGIRINRFHYASVAAFDSISHIYFQPRVRDSMEHV